MTNGVSGNAALDLSPIRVGDARRRKVGSETILLVEDDEYVRMIAHRVLSGVGYTVLQANDGHSAVDACDCHAGPIDLLLTDVIMPRMSGWQVSERISASRPGIKVLFMSGYDDDTIAQGGLRKEDFTLLEKPFTMVGLLDEVGAALERQTQDGGHSQQNPMLAEEVGLRLSSS